MDASGRPVDEVLAELDEARAAEPDPHGAHLFGLTYPTGDAELERLTHAVHDRMLYSNALNPFRFPEQARLAETVVRSVGDLVHLPGDGGGSTTSGGTESILMASLVARGRARARGVERGAIVAPTSAHPAYAKAAHLLDLDFVPVPIDESTFCVDLDALRGTVDDRTALVVASAFSYPHGVLDDVAAVAAIAAENGANCHVDACVGGMVLPFAERAGVREVPAWDFRVPGVTSMSVDLHKYGYVPKGCSVVLHRSPDWAGHQWFVYDRWPAGLYGSPAVAGAKSAAPVLAAWAVMRHLGLDGYTRIVADLLATTEQLRAGIEGVEGCRVLGDPVGSILSWASDDPALDLYAVGDAMEARGWFLNRLTGSGGGPAGLHVMVSPKHSQVLDALVADLRDASAQVRAQGLTSDDAGRYA
jgi:glutamate/tyrosine decarboxylase-like PLP-dependent enzyme